MATLLTTNGHRLRPSRHPTAPVEPAAHSAAPKAGRRRSLHQAAGETGDIRHQSPQGAVHGSDLAAQGSGQGASGGGLGPLMAGLLTPGGAGEFQTTPPADAYRALTRDQRQALERAALAQAATAPPENVPGQTPLAALKAIHTQAAAALNANPRPDLDAASDQHWAQHVLHEADGIQKAVSQEGLANDTGNLRRPGARVAPASPPGRAGAPTAPSPAATAAQIKQDLALVTVTAATTAKTARDERLRQLAGRDPVSYAAAQLASAHPHDDAYQRALARAMPGFRRDYTTEQVNRHLKSALPTMARAANDQAAGNGQGSKGFWGTVAEGVSQVGGFFKGAGEGVAETAKGAYVLAYSAVDTAVDVAGGALVDGTLAAYKGITGNQVDNKPAFVPDFQRGIDSLKNAGETVAAVAKDPGKLLDAVEASIVNDWKGGNYGEAIGRGTVDVAGVVLGAKGAIKAGSAAKEVVSVARDARANAKSLKHVNPEHRVSYPYSPLLNNSPFQSNCVKCVIATDATLDGRPSSALPTSVLDPPTSGSKVVEDYFGKRFDPDIHTRSGVEQTIKDAGRGARGIVWGESPKDPNLRFHMFNVENRGGKIVYLDGQIAKRVKPSAIDAAGYGRLTILLTNR